MTNSRDISTLLKSIEAGAPTKKIKNNESNEVPIIENYLKGITAELVAPWDVASDSYIGDSDSRKDEPRDPRKHRRYQLIEFRTNRD